MKRYTTKDFILKAMALYDGKYDYSKVEYINNHTKALILTGLYNLSRTWRILANTKQPSKWSRMP